MDLESEIRYRSRQLPQTHCMRSAGALSCAFRSVSAIVCRTAVGRRTVAVSVGPPAAPAAQRDTASALLSTADAASGHGLTGPVRQLIRVDRFSPPADQGSENHPPAASAPYADPPADWRLQPDSRSIYRTSRAGRPESVSRVTPAALVARACAADETTWGGVCDCVGQSRVVLCTPSFGSPRGRMKCERQERGGGECGRSDAVC